jgi:hypothetical protein
VSELADGLTTLLGERHSCRGFLPRAVPKETITRILGMAQRTPSWCNSQPWQVIVTSGAATIGSSVTANVSEGATLELAGSVSALAAGPSRVFITNNSTVAGVIVTGTNQRTGPIEGSGNLTITAAADLTADHILQSAIIVQGTPGALGRLTIAASDSTGSPLNGDAVAATALDSRAVPVTPALVGTTPLAPSLGFPESEIAGFAESSTDGGLSVPEPSTIVLALVALCGAVCCGAFRHGQG